MCLERRTRQEQQKQAERKGAGRLLGAPGLGFTLSKMGSQRRACSERSSLQCLAWKRTAIVLEQAALCLEGRGRASVRNARRAPCPCWGCRSAFVWQVTALSASASQRTQLQAVGRHVCVRAGEPLGRAREHL